MMPSSWTSSSAATRSNGPSGHGAGPEPGTVWTVAQLRAFLATAQQHRLFAFFHVAAYTGARRGELLNLRWKDIDLDGKKITITGSTAVIAGERVKGTTKSGRTRVVPIDDETVAVLRQRKADQAAEQLQGGRLLARDQGRVRVHDRLGRADLPRYRHIADDQAHPRPQQPQRKASYRTLGCMISGTSTPRPCCSLASPSMSSRPGSATPIPLSPYACTPTSSAAPRPPPRTSSPRP